MLKGTEKNTMKKIVALLLVLAMTLALAACGHGEDTDVSITAFGVGRYEHVTGKCLNFIGAVCEDGAFFDLI